MVATSARAGGGESYLSSQLQALTEIEGLELVIYASAEIAESLAVCVPRARVHRCPRRGLVRRVWWEQIVLPVHARNYDVVYLTGNFALLASPRPQVIALQSAHHFGSDSRRVRRSLGSRRFRLRVGTEAWAARRSVRRATRAVAISESLARAVREDLGPVSTLHIVRGASPSKFLRVQPNPTTKRTAPYVLAVADDYPHKDWDGLIATFLRHTDLPELVLVGACRSASRRASLTTMLAGSGRVELMGPIHDPAVLYGLYGGASCVVAHSYLESFGFTPCEALTIGVPVVASDLPAHREVCGHDAYYYDVSSAGDLVAAVHRALARTSRPSISSSVLRRTWAQNASELADVLKSAAGDSVPRPRTVSLTVSR